MPNPGKEAYDLTNPYEKESGLFKKSCYDFAPHATIKTGPERSSRHAEARHYPLVSEKGEGMKHRLTLVVGVCLFLVLVAATPVFAATVAVGTCMPNRVSFDSLTDAVQGVPPGSTILVCPGVYAEQIIITKSLTLKGVSSGNSGYPVIVPPPGGLLGNALVLPEPLLFFSAGTPLAAQVFVQNTADVTISDIAVDGTGYGIAGCSPVVVGILIQDSSANLSGVVGKNQLQTSVSPCFGLGSSGIAVLSQNDTAAATEVKVVNSSFFNYGQGYESDGTNNTSILTNNSFAGNPASDGNSINVLNGPSTITGNTVSNSNFPALPPNALFSSAFGVFLDCVTSATVANNTVASSQFGIITSRAGSCLPTGLSITGNKVSNSQFVGIYLSSANGLVQGNDIRTSQTAIRTDPLAGGNTIRGNQINDTCAALSSDPATPANIIGPNTISNAVNLALVNTTALCP
jgi:parallel beta-helix repeat protein